MTPEEKARLVIDEKLRQSGWVIQDMKKLNLSAALGVAVREFPTSTGEVDYALSLTASLWVLPKPSVRKKANLSPMLRCSLGVMPTASSNG